MLDSYPAVLTAIKGEKQVEAADVATYFNPMGISVFVVNYRVLGMYKLDQTKGIFSDNFNYRQILSDGTRAMKMTRYNAISNYVNPNKKKNEIKNYEKTKFILFIC